MLGPKRAACKRLDSAAKQADHPFPLGCPVLVEVFPRWVLDHGVLVRRAAVLWKRRKEFLATHTGA